MLRGEIRMASILHVIRGEQAAASGDRQQRWSKMQRRVEWAAVS